jgi:hypothetical protein
MSGKIGIFSGNSSEKSFSQEIPREKTYKKSAPDKLTKKMLVVSNTEDDFPQVDDVVSVTGKAGVRQVLRKHISMIKFNFVTDDAPTGLCHHTSGAALRNWSQLLQQHKYSVTK